jgi:hypothetical protein
MSWCSASLLPTTVVVRPPSLGRFYARTLTRRTPLEHVGVE